MKVPWRTVCKDETSPFANLSGIETFEDGEEESNIHINIPQDPRDQSQDKFEVVLGDPKPSTSIVDPKNKCSITVENDVISALINVEKDEIEALQSEKNVFIPLSRTKQQKGKILVPWKVLPKSSDSVYANIDGKSTFISFHKSFWLLLGIVTIDDGESEAFIDLSLPQVPLADITETISVVIDQPLSSLAKLGYNRNCLVTVRHNQGKFLFVDDLF